MIRIEITEDVKFSMLRCCLRSNKVVPKVVGIMHVKMYMIVLSAMAPTSV